MKQNRNLLLIAVLMMLLISSYTVCGQPTEKYLICSENKDNISYDLSARKYTAELDPFSVSLPGDQEEHTINLIIAADVDIYSAYMRLAPVEGELSPTDVNITLNDESIMECQGEFTEVECSDELRGSLKEYLDTKKGECPVTVPLVFTSQNGGTIKFEAFSVRFRISPVKELEPLMDPEIGLPKYFLWTPCVGAEPRYELEIRSDSCSSDTGDSKLKKTGITNTRYKLDEYEIENLQSTLKAGETYYCCVRVVYDFGHSWWTEATFTTKPAPVQNLRFEGFKETEKEESEEQVKEISEVTFAWEHENAEYFIIWLNGHVLKYRWTKQSYKITDPEDLYYVCSCDKEPCSKNTLTVWAVSGNQKSEPKDLEFTVKVGKLAPPTNLSPNLDRLVKEEKLHFKWEDVDRAAYYEVELRDADGKLIPFPIEIGVTNVDGKVKVEDNHYDPADLNLVPGRLYKWSVEAKPPENSPIMSSEKAEMFFYQPVDLWILTLCAGFGGLLGGFIRIAHQEKKRAGKRETMLHKDYRTYIELLVGIIIGVIFYLIINETLSPTLNQLNITPFSYPGSLILGFIGGIISYEITKLRPAALD